MFDAKKPQIINRDDGWVGWNQFSSAMFNQDVELFRHSLSPFVIFQCLRDTCGPCKLWEGLFCGEVDLLWYINVVHGSYYHVVLSGEGL